MINQLWIGFSGISTAQKAITTLGQNVTNATVPSYSRRNPLIKTSTINSGVEYARDLYVDDDLLRSRYEVINSQRKYHEVLQQYVTQLEEAITNNDLLSGINDFYNLITRVQFDHSYTAELISKLNQLTVNSNRIMQIISDIRQNIRQQIHLLVNEYNQKIKTIADAITYEEYYNNNTVRDLINDSLYYLSDIIDFRIGDRHLSPRLLASDGLPLLLGIQTYELTIDYVDDDIQIRNNLGNYHFNYGKLGALIYLYNSYIPNVMNNINHIISDFIRNINHVQATGLSQTGSFNTLISTISVSDIYSPLSTQSLPMPITSGHLTISVTDTSTNTRTNYTIFVDPNIHSLQNIATSLSSIPGITATADPTTGLLTINAYSGYKFDFAGRDTEPPTGTSVSEPDTAGILSALGINPVLLGYDAQTIALNPELINRSSLLSLSKNSVSGNYDNLLRFLQTKDKSYFTNENMLNELSKLYGNIGLSINSYAYQYDLLVKQHNDIVDSLQNTAGVDTNEQFIHILAFQKLLDASSRYVSVVNKLYDTIIAIID
ncbi:MAG: hypothetical protein RMJ88_03370 [Thermogemmata sp.]|nr:hypothetical protein [Thermogemmata sp.]